MFCEKRKILGRVLLLYDGFHPFLNLKNAYTIIYKVCGIDSINRQHGCQVESSFKIEKEIFHPEIYPSEPAAPGVPIWPNIVISWWQLAIAETGMKRLVRGVSHATSMRPAARTPEDARDSSYELIQEKYAARLYPRWFLAPPPIRRAKNSFLRPHSPGISTSAARYSLLSTLQLARGIKSAGWFDPAHYNRNGGPANEYKLLGINYFIPLSVRPSVEFVTSVSLWNARRVRHMQITRRCRDSVVRLFWGLYARGTWIRT